MTDDERFEAIKLYYADNEYIPHRDEGFVLSYAERHRARADRAEVALSEAVQRPAGLDARLSEIWDDHVERHDEKPGNRAGCDMCHVLLEIRRHRARSDRLAGAATAFADFLHVRDVTVWLQTRAEHEELTRLHGALRAALAAPAGGEGDS
jgi:hypothetical protein